MKGYVKFYLVGAISVFVICVLYHFGKMTTAESIEAGLLLFSGLILILYTKATQEMKKEMVNQTCAILTPSLVITFTGIESGKAKFRLENFSRDNIVRNFYGILIYGDQNVDEQKLQVVVHGGNNKLDYPESKWIYFNNVSDEYLKNREKLKFKCSYFDRTGKFLFVQEISSLYKEPMSA